MAKKISYVLMDPAGNRTILAETPVEAARQPAAAARLMRLEPSAEQVGFVTIINDNDNNPAAGGDFGEESAPGPVPDLALRMAGGEFCGNASMSAAVLYLIRAGKEQGEVIVKVSGAEKPVRAKIRAMGNGLWQGDVAMPGPESAEIVRFPDGQELPVVSFRGISHVIVEYAMEPDTAEKLVKEWCDFLQADALGLLFLEQGGERSEPADSRSARRMSGSLTPLVYVPAADTLFWESACGSGTTAVGAWLARELGEPVTLSLRQPGGVLEIDASPDGPLLLKGTVRCLREGTADL